MNNMKVYFFIIAASLLVTACAQTHQPGFIYSDGCANVYTVYPDSIVYDPVRPEESSSGIYSGGEPYTAVITPEQFSRIFNEVRILEENLSLQTDQRNMMTGQFEIYSPEGISIFIVKNGEALDEFNRLLSDEIGRK